MIKLRPDSVKPLVLPVLMVMLVLGGLLFADSYSAALYNDKILLGWAMFVLMVILLLFNVRKKLSVVPIGRSSVWLSLHIYSGLLMLILFVAHCDYRWPNGVFENILAWLFLLVAVSGLAGLWLSRKLAYALAQQAEPVVYERLPGLRDHLRKQVESRVEQAVKECGAYALSEFYEKHLFDYLSAWRDFWTHLLRSNAVSTLWNTRFDVLQTYLGGSGSVYVSEIRDLTARKADLDYQWAARSILKCWLFIHVPVSCALMLFVLLHCVLIYAFGWSMI